ncbi:hypothetical protein PZA11_007715 [Diplocarpon coronariae]
MTSAGQTGSDPPGKALVPLSAGALEHLKKLFSLPGLLFSSIIRPQLSSPLHSTPLTSEASPLSILLWSYLPQSSAPKSKPIPPLKSKLLNLSLSLTLAPLETFSTLFRRFFDIPDSEPIFPRSQSKISSQSLSSAPAWYGASDARARARAGDKGRFGVGAAEERRGRERERREVVTLPRRRPSPSHNSQLSTSRANLNLNPFTSDCVASAPGPSRTYTTTAPSIPTRRSRNPFSSSLVPVRVPVTAAPGAAPAASFELTPLSGLIKQSFTDLEVLKRVHAETIQTGGGGTGAGVEGKGKGKATEEEVGMVVDFERVERNLKKFEEVYRSFLSYGGAYGEKHEEVHLVAMVCRRSEVATGTLSSGPGVPKARAPGYNR